MKTLQPVNGKDGGHAKPPGPCTKYSQGRVLGPEECRRPYRTSGPSTPGPRPRGRGRAPARLSSPTTVMRALPSPCLCWAQPVWGVVRMRVTTGRVCGRVGGSRPGRVRPVRRIPPGRTAEQALGPGDDDDVSLQGQVQLPPRVAPLRQVAELPQLEPSGGRRQGVGRVVVRLEGCGRLSARGDELHPVLTQFPLARFERVPANLGLDSVAAPGHRSAKGSHACQDEGDRQIEPPGPALRGVDGHRYHAGRAGDPAPDRATPHTSAACHVRLVHHAARDRAVALGPGSRTRRRGRSTGGGRSAPSVGGSDVHPESDRADSTRAVSPLFVVSAGGLGPTAPVVGAAGCGRGRRRDRVDLPAGACERPVGDHCPEAFVA